MPKLFFCVTVSFMSFNCTGLCYDVNVKFISDQLHNKSVDIGMIHITQETCGGVAIMWHKRIAGTILPSKSNSNRMCSYYEAK